MHAIIQIWSSSINCNQAVRNKAAPKWVDMTSSDAKIAHRLAAALAFPGYTRSSTKTSIAVNVSTAADAKASTDGSQCDTKNSHIYAVLKHVARPKAVRVRARI